MNIVWLILAIICIADLLTFIIIIFINRQVNYFTYYLCRPFWSCPLFGGEGIKMPWGFVVRIGQCVYATIVIKDLIMSLIG